MSRYPAVFAVCCAIIFGTLQDASLGAVPADDSVLAAKIDSLEAKINRLEQINRLEGLKDSMKEEREKVYKVYVQSIESANMTYNIVYGLLGLLFIGLVGGALGWVKILSGIKKYARKKAEEGVKEEIRKAGARVKNRLKKLGIDQERLDTEFSRILQRSDYHDLLFQLQSSENEQALSVRSFIEKPAENNPIIISALTKLARAEEPRLRAQSMFARYACGDKAALDELRALLVDKNKAMREAADEALSEMSERFREVAITS